MAAEVWKPIEGYEGVYQISSLGRVYSNISHKILSLGDTGDGYLKIKLKGKSFKVHRLVAHAFIPNPNNKPQVNHKNRIRNDNRIENLEWMDNADNTKYSYDMSLKNIEYKNPRIKLSDEIISYILKNYVKGSRKFGANALAREFGVSQPTISYITKRQMKYLEVIKNGTRKTI